MALERTKRGPKYTVREVTRQVFVQHDVGSVYDGRTVVEGFHDQQDNEYLLVVKERADEPGIT